MTLILPQISLATPDGGGGGPSGISSFTFNSSRAEGDKADATYPTGWSAGDIGVILAASKNSVLPSVPSGWNRLTSTIFDGGGTSDIAAQILWRLLESGDSTTVTGINNTTDWGHYSFRTFTPDVTISNDDITGTGVSASSSGSSATITVDATAASGVALAFGSVHRANGFGLSFSTEPFDSHFNTTDSLKDGYSLAADGNSYGPYGASLSFGRSAALGGFLDVV